MSKSDNAVLDQLLQDLMDPKTEVSGQGDLLKQLTAALTECALEGEMSDRLGHERGDPAGQGTGNSRNGKGRKTVQTGDCPYDQLEACLSQNGVHRYPDSPA